MLYQMVDGHNCENKKSMESYSPRKRDDKLMWQLSAYYAANHEIGCLALIDFSVIYF
jgi:hypothetical protein